MKFNFLKILNNQINAPEEIVEQIVALEQKQIECEKQYDLLRTQAKELRQRKLCGEAISDEQVKEADRKAENISLDLEAITESIAKLEEKLHRTYEAIQESGSSVASERQNALLPEFNKLSEELARAKSRVIVVAEQLWGYMAKERLRQSSIFQPDERTDHWVKEEEEKLRAAIKQPTYYEKYNQVQRYASWAMLLNVNQEAQRILNEYRKNAGIPVKETV